MDPKRQVYAELDATLAAAATEWHRVASAAWQRLRQEDPELADLTISLFETEEEAASWFARPQKGATCYGRLAAGEREGICQQLLGAQYGFGA